MGLGQKYSIGDRKTSMYFWANSDAEAISLIKHHKFTINKDTRLTNRTSKKSIKINEN
jgi:hypothetical protein